MTIIGDEFKRRRIDLGMSQADVGRGAGTAQMSVGNIERGKVKDPGVITLGNIARTLGMEAAEVTTLILATIDEAAEREESSALLARAYWTPAAGAG
jgi:transcriptional regulator with XRE-family HTH domain